MLAFALRSDGGYLRQEIIWNKPNPIPESVTGRCAKSHEYIFLLSKNELVRIHMRASRRGVILVKGQRFDLHNLRHSLSTWMVNKGKVDPKTVQGMLRHSDIRTTMNLYTQDDRDEKQTAQGAFLSAVGLEVVECNDFVGSHCDCHTS